MNDTEFDHLLRTTRDFVPLSPSFRQGVWERLATAEAGCSSEIVRFPKRLTTCTRPWGAAASIAAMVTLGLWLGATTAPEAKDAKVAYAESISPFAHAYGK